MSIRLSNLRLGVDESELALPAQIARELGLGQDDVQQWRILRKSLDARDKRDLAFVYSVEVAVLQDESRLISKSKKLSRGVSAELYQEPPFELPAPGAEPLRHRPVIVGSGPAGLFAAYFLAERGYRPLVLERGRPCASEFATSRPSTPAVHTILIAITCLAKGRWDV